MRNRRGPLSFRPSLTQMRRQSKVWLDAMADATGRERITGPEPAVRAARQPAQSPRPKPGRIEASEADVKTAVLRFLAAHPNVATVILHNSGTAYNANGQPVAFYRVIKGPELLVDIGGELNDGRTYRIELKREGWRMAGDNATHDGAVRERKQLACIQDCISRGGVGGFVTSVEEARAVIEGDS